MSAIIATLSIPDLKQQIQYFQGQLRTRFDKNEPIESLIESRSDFIDHLLTNCWNQILGDASVGLSLVATGGYGRAELHPESDIDLLILHTESDLEKHKQALERFATFLWDIGLKPGLSVRTLDDCYEQSKADITVITNIMESRLITGSEELFNDLLNLTHPTKVWPANDFFVEKIEEQSQRHIKFGDTAYNLEPNIKEGPGGLRDIQTIQWITQRYFGSRSLGELVNHAFLTKNEYRTLIKGQKLLWEIRFVLHLLAGCPEDRLLFEYQKSLAESFGFNDEGETMAVEGFMQLYYLTINNLERINELVVQVFYEAMEDKAPDVRPLNESFRVINNAIEISQPNLFEVRPLALLDIFYQIQINDNIEEIRAFTIRQIRQNLHLIDDEFRKNKEAQKLFLDIIRHPHGITHQFRRMNRYGVLGAYIPAFKDIVGRMQYDLFHIYTVDQHTLFVVRNLRRFALEKHKDELPFCYEVFQNIPKPELLYLAGLFHDIAKGRGGDHSTKGQIDAEEFCDSHGLSKYDTKLVGRLVKSHLIMSMTAQRKDIHDPAVIQKFAKRMQSIEFLDYLYLLTVADIRATSPKLWNSWKDSLLKELHINTKRVLRRGLNSPDDEGDKITIKQTQARALLKAKGLSGDLINAVWRSINKDYFERFSVDDSVWHTIAIASCQQNELPLVLLRSHTTHGGAEIFCYVGDRAGTFAVCTATLDQLGLNILDARIITTDQNIALISFHVLEGNSEAIFDLSREQYIVNTLKKNLAAPEQAQLNVERQSTRQSKYFDTETTIRFSKDSKKRYNIVEITTHDRPGILSIIGQCFSHHKINVRNAKIATIGSKAEDTFFVTDAQDKIILDTDVLENLKQSLIEYLSPIQEN